MWNIVRSSSRSGGDVAKEAEIVILNRCVFHFSRSIRIWCQIQVQIYPLINLIIKKNLISDFLAIAVSQSYDIL